MSIPESPTPAVEPCGHLFGVNGTMSGCLYPCQEPKGHAGQHFNEDAGIWSHAPAVERPGVPGVLGSEDALLAEIRARFHERTLTETYCADKFLELWSVALALRAALATVTRERDEARRDSERLDWLIDHTFFGRFDVELSPGHCTGIDASRLAIDAARLAAPSAPAPALSTEG